MTQVTPRVREGERVPEVPLHVCKGHAAKAVAASEFFAGKTVVLFALPGAFTPTCSSAHLPRYSELAPAFERAGVDAVACLAVNDAYVMDAWIRDQQVHNITLLADGNAEFTEAMGLLVDKREAGLGMRSWRYAMVVRDGVIVKLFVEPDLPGDPYEVSDADTVLDYLAPTIDKPLRIALFTKPGCPHCSRAKQALSERGYSFAELELGARAGISYAAMYAIAGASSTPQVFIEGKSIGGADQLLQWLAAREAKHNAA